MSIPISDRVLVRALREIARERGIEMTAFSHDWVIRLRKPPLTQYVLGYNFEGNPATAHLLTNDKSAASAILRDNDIPSVEHRLFVSPEFGECAPAEGTWKDIADYAAQHDHQLVCKPNDGSCGRDVFRVRSQHELERVVQELFQRHRCIALSPFCEIDHEYRAVMVMDECALAYAKERPIVTGDGRSTVLELLADAARHAAAADALPAAALADCESRLRDVPAEGEVRELSWRRNLGLGARPQAIADGQVLQQLTTLATACMRAFNLRFASVDVIDTGGEHRVLEVNSGIMVEWYARTAPDGYATAKRIYAKVVDRMFAEA